MSKPSNEPAVHKRSLPQVDRVLRHPTVGKLDIRRDILASLVRGILDDFRSQDISAAPSVDQVAELVLEKAEGLRRPALVPVINATGIILNTNLGRAPLSAEAVRRLAEVAGNYSNLEIDLESGKRGDRTKPVEELVSLLTGSERALVVNNNAAAVLLAVNTLSLDREVVVSRGQLIEIGGNFRLPELIVSSGGILKEIGTTNRTRLSDYQNALSDRSGIILCCHQSNYQITGFTEEVSLKDLSALSESTAVPLVEDLGSGVICSLPLPELSREPTVANISSTCDLVTFSGDKLLGGPQAGILAGRRTIIEKLYKNPLYRALRPDKLTLSALESSLRSYLSPEPESLCPALSMLINPVSTVKDRAEEFARKANSVLKHLRCVPTETRSEPGGGTLPGVSIDSFGISIESAQSASSLVKRFRMAAVPVIGFVHEDRFLLDFRTILPGQEELLFQVVMEIESQLL